MIPEITINEHLVLPVLGLGTWEMGGRQTADKTEDNKWITAIETAIGKGIRHIDTAAIYGAGHTERLVGQAIKNFDRKELFITTKVSGDSLQFAQVLKSAKESCKRLNIDQIDLFLLHWPSAAVPISQTISAINKLWEEGQICNFGLSNFPVNLMREVAFFSNAPIITNQVEYNLFTRNKANYNQNIESEIIPYCLKNGISITAWRPMMKDVEGVATHSLLLSLAEKYGKSPFQIALNWLINKPMMMAIPKMTSEQHITENIEATQFNMEQADLMALDNLPQRD